MKFCSKNEILFKNRNFGQKSKLWSKIVILVKIRNFGQNSKFWSKIEILAKNQNFGPRQNSAAHGKLFPTLGRTAKCDGQTRAF